jgi:hypothetical protein
MISELNNINNHDKQPDSNKQTETNVQSETNYKKIKYKLMKVNPNINYEINGSYKKKITCSYDFLEFKFGKSYGITDNINSNVQWIIMVKTSNGFEYPIKIYECESCKIKLEDINDWYIDGENYEFLDYDKLTRILNFEYTNYFKKQKKIIKKNNKISNPHTCQTISKQLDKTKFVNIDIDKFNKLDKDELNIYTDDELVCVLFTRFKESTNPLLKNTLILHNVLSYKTLNNDSVISKKKTNYNFDKNSIKKKDKSKYNKTKFTYIDIDKFKKLDKDSLNKFSDYELVCVLLIRFKKSRNLILKNILILHNVLSNKILNNNVTIICEKKIN